MEFESFERLRFYTGEFDRIEGVAAYEFIVRQAHQSGLLGATVFRGSMGFGGHGEVHTAKILRLVEDLPIIVEIVDQPVKTRAFCELVVPVMQKGLVTRDVVEALSLTRG